MGRVAGGVLKRDEGAEPDAEDDRALDPKRSAQVAHVVRPALEPVLLGRACVAAARAAHVEVDDLRPRCEPRADLHLEEAVIEPGPRMEEEHGRTLPHPRPVGNELRAVDVEEQAHIAYLYTHGATLLLPGIRQRNWSQPDDRESTRDRRGTRRVGDRRAAARARARAVRGRAGARAALRARPRDRRGGAAASRRGRGSRTSAAPRRSPRSTRTRAASACIRCRRSRARAAPSSSTAPGPRSPPRPTRRARSRWLARDDARARAVRRSPTTSGRALSRRRGDRVELSGHALPRRRARCSRPRARRPRRSCR